jgi:hypothetical protein
MTQVALLYTASTTFSVSTMVLDRVGRKAECRYVIAERNSEKYT